MGVSTIHDLPDDLLRWILLRLDSSLWLIRAACVCKRWRRVVTDGGAEEGRAFLRLASSLHPPTVVGQYHIHTSGDHRFVPSSSPIVDGSRFSVDDFLDKDEQYACWHIADCHGGLVLLSMSDWPCAGSVPNLIVYDPLTRKHRSISGPPTRKEQGFRYGTREVFLLDGDDGHISISNFKVLHRHLNDARAATACVFSRGLGGEWGWRLLSRRLSLVTCQTRTYIPADRCTPLAASTDPCTWACWMVVGS
jgi:hypothetical protein